jgi:serine/threonine-protein kinase
VTEPNAENAAAAPRRLFHLKQRIGAGAFGEVYLAEQDSGAGFRRPVALKVLNANALGSNDAARRMRDEARILGRLSHRNIVGVLDLVRLGDRWAVVMDYVEGADIEQIEMALFERNETMPAPAAFEVGAAVCRALHVAHHADDGQGGQLQVVHRDIKPSNIRVTTDGEVKVLDFGVARVELDTREAQTKAGGWIGTERYMAPERILMEGDEPWGDVYATGASIIEMILLEPLGRTPVLPHRHEPVVAAAIANVRAKLRGPPEVVDRACELLALSVDANPEARPTADALSEAFADIARQLEGETLARFCRRFVPQVDEILGNTVEAVDGVLSEGSGIATVAGVAGVGGASLTFVDPPGDATTVTPRKGLVLGGLAAVAVLVVGALVVVVGGGLAFAALSWSTSEPASGAADPGTPVQTEVDPALPVEPVDAKPIDAAPVEAEPVEAEPIEDPVAEDPVAPKPRPRADPGERPAAVRPAVTSVTPETPTVDPDAPRVSAAAFAVQDASSVTVQCGDVSQSGTASVRIRDFPAGKCRVNAIYGGKGVSTTVEVDRRREVRCTVQSGSLKCG